MEDVVNAQPFDLSSIRMPMKDTGPVLAPGVVVTPVMTGVVAIAGVWLGALAVEHALNRQVMIMVRSVPNQIKVGRFLDIVSIG